MLLLLYGTFHFSLSLSLYVYGTFCILYLIIVYYTVCESKSVTELLYKSWKLNEELHELKCQSLRSRYEIEEKTSFTYYLIDV